MAIKRIAGKPNFSDQFKKMVKRYKNGILHGHATVCMQKNMEQRTYVSISVCTCVCVWGGGGGAAQGMNCKINTTNCYLVHLGTWRQLNVVSHIHLNVNEPTQNTCTKS